jgi:signal transduction histidine kinase
MTKEFLQRLELFSGLPEADLEALAAQTEPMTVAPGQAIIEQGTPGDSAYIVVDGEFEVLKKSEAQEIVIAVREGGEVFGEMALLDQAPRTATVRAKKESHVLRLPGAAFQKTLTQSPSAAMSILKTVSKRLRQNEGLLRQSEKMAALGTLSAGLAHELNNPAAAVRRSAAQLREAITTWSARTTDLARCNYSADQMKQIEALKAKLEAERPEAELDPLAQSDREAEMQTWMEGLGIEEAWDIAPALVGIGWDREELAQLTQDFDGSTLPILLRWLAGGATTYAMLDEIRTGSERLSEIVQAVKAYSYLDQGPVQEVDIHKGLENTLVILRHKMKQGVTVKREYGDEVQPIEAHGSELNQVWTNIIDNAVDAMHGEGQITLRTRSNGKRVEVELEDNGPGIPPEIQKRIFEPFFTTKPPGMGTGLGLHIAYTIVNNHNGKISVTSKPGKTLFHVELPTQLPR